MADLPDRETLAGVLMTADAVHEEYERSALKGMGDDKWPGFVAAFVIGRLGEFVPASPPRAPHRGSRGRATTGPARRRTTC